MFAQDLMSAVYHHRNHRDITIHRQPEGSISEVLYLSVFGASTFRK